MLERILMKNYKTLHKGFTLVELMIATAVLSTILLLATVMIMGIGRLYYKGINQSRVQDNVRAITDDTSQRLKLNDGQPTTAENPIVYRGADGNFSTVTAWCIGPTRYSFVIGRQIGPDTARTTDSQIPHVLWRDTTPSEGCKNPADLRDPALSNGTDMVGSGMRLTVFSIAPDSSPYALTVGLANGDKDLFTGSGAGTHCTGGPGGEFCSTSYLKTTVVKRLRSGE
jgi:prepilin-type N-terminal cleavage/methylation domain-containing protein